jgi:hypothetical protein
VKSTQNHFVMHDPGASLASVDPGSRMCAAVITQAWRDLLGQDVFLFFDALLWFLTESPLWFDAIDMNVDPDRILWTIIRGGVKGGMTSGRRRVKARLIDRFEEYINDLNERELKRLKTLLVTRFPMFMQELVEEIKEGRQDDK